MSNSSYTFKKQVSFPNLMSLSKARLQVKNMGGFLTAYISDEVNEEIYMSFIYINTTLIFLFF